MTKPWIIDLLSHFVDGNYLINVLIKCPLDGETHGFSVSIDHEQQLADVIDGVDNRRIQDALPFLNDTQREQILTGLCPYHQDLFFSDPDDE